jgi:hypothetical protein
MSADMVVYKTVTVWNHSADLGAQLFNISNHNCRARFACYQPKPSARFHDFGAYEQLVAAASRLIPAPTSSSYWAVRRVYHAGRSRRWRGVTLICRSANSALNGPSGRATQQRRKAGGCGTYP